MINVGIVGCTGYTAIEAIRILLRHPSVNIVAATSRQADRRLTVADLHPQFMGRIELMVEDLTPEQIAERCDVALCCLPHAASAPIVSRILAAGARVIDLSADYRLSDPALYEQWYGTPHPDPARLGHTPYGLPELFAAEIKSADLVANPGCYPTSAILPLAPVIRQGLVEPATVVVDSKSGVSGAGRTPKMVNLFSEANESLAAYSVGTHRHQPEIADIIGRFTGTEPEIVFTPHLTPMDRGILSTIYARPTEGTKIDQILDCLSAVYAHEPFVRVVRHLPATKHVAYSNNCDITVRENGGWIILISAIDNLVKGASGAAVQCMNLMFNLEQTDALDN